VLLAACASPQPADYRSEGPPLDLRQLLQRATLVAHGIFMDRSGKRGAPLHGGR
jgi:hypothetical protein